MGFRYKFSFRESEELRFNGELYLNDSESDGEVGFREGTINVEDGGRINLILCNSPSTSAFMYTSERKISEQYWRLFGINIPIPENKVALPGQLILGPERTRLVQGGVKDLLSSPQFKKLLENKDQENIITLPVLREGVK